MTAVATDIPSRDPLALVRSLWTLYLLGLRQHLHGKRWIVMTLLFLAPAGLAMLVRAASPNAPPFGMEFVLVFMFIPQAVLPLLGLIYSSGMIQDEQEEQTITYLLVRPLSKWSIYIAKLASAITTSIFLTIVFTALTYAVIYVNQGDRAANAPMRCLQAILIHSLAVLAYCCLFGLLSLVTKRILVVGILYTAIFEGLFANLAFSVRMITVVYYTRLIAFRTIDFRTGDRNDPNANIAAEAWHLDIVNDPFLREHPQRVTCIFILLAASLAMALVAAFICSRREFHVKTPGKD